MRLPRRIAPSPLNPRLGLRRTGERTEFWTETPGQMPAVYGERWLPFEGLTFRSFDPGRSKLAAALARGWEDPLPRPRERWLYLGAASGTTASHVADLVGPAGRVYAIERSVRPFARLLKVAERWPNLLPILGDARAPEGYADLVPTVDGLYCDVAQPDQIALVRANAAWFLASSEAAVLVALKTSSMGRELPAAAHLRRAEEELGGVFALEESVRLEPAYRSHYLIGGRRSASPPRTHRRAPHLREGPERARPWRRRRGTPRAGPRPRPYRR